jgi:hypothetical protein
MVVASRLAAGCWLAAGWWAGGLARPAEHCAVARTRTPALFQALTGPGGGA